MIVLKIVGKKGRVDDEVGFSLQHSRSS